MLPWPVPAYHHLLTKEILNKTFHMTKHKTQHKVMYHVVTNNTSLHYYLGSIKMHDLVAISA